jgi:uncharacterized protein (DUF486 family)
MIDQQAGPGTKWTPISLANAPANRIGNTFLTPAQISLSSYVFDFLAQLWSNAFWLNLPTTIDDYIGMFLILFGMYAAKYTLFG